MIEIIIFTVIVTLILLCVCNSAYRKYLDDNNRMWKTLLRKIPQVSPSGAGSMRNKTVAIVGRCTPSGKLYVSPIGGVSCVAYRCNAFQRYDAKRRQGGHAHVERKWRLLFGETKASEFLLSDRTCGILVESDDLDIRMDQPEGKQFRFNQTQIDNKENSKIVEFFEKHDHRDDLSRDMCRLREGTVKANDVVVAIGMVVSDPHDPSKFILKPADVSLIDITRWSWVERRALNLLKSGKLVATCCAEVVNAATIKPEELDLPDHASQFHAYASEAASHNQAPQQPAAQSEPQIIVDISDVHDNDHATRNKDGSELPAF